MNNLNELTTATNTGTITVVGTTTSPATNVTVWGTGLSSGSAALYSDSTWARTNASRPNGNATYNAAGYDSLGRSDTNAVNVYLPNTVTYTYDLNGNLTSDGTRYFAYDDEDQLTSVWVTNGWRSDFVYDGRMRRRKRIEYTWASSAWVQTNEVHYIYDGNLIVQERDANNLPTTSYTHGRDLGGTLQGAGGIGGLLARTDHGLLTVGSDGAHAYYHSDANGNITTPVNSRQVIVASYLYDPFGTIIAQSGPLAIANLYRFSSKEFDSVRGLAYYLYRFYDSSCQRWLTRDPIGERGGLNLHRFAHNNPVTFIDKWGLCHAVWGCVPYVTDYTKSPEADEAAKAGIKIFHDIETFERVLSLAAVIAANEAIGLEAAIETAAEKVLDMSTRPDVGKQLEPLFEALRNERGGFGRWTAWTRITFTWVDCDCPPKEKDGGWFKVRTGGIDENGTFQNEDEAFRAAASECDTLLRNHANSSQ